MILFFQWMGYGKNFTVPPIGLSGGLTLFWMDGVDLEVLLSSPNFIDTKIKSKDKKIYLTFVYGHPTRSKRRDVWNVLSAIGATRETSWFFMGDFNDILDNSKKEEVLLDMKASLLIFEASFHKMGCGMWIISVILYHREEALWSLCKSKVRLSYLK